MVAAVVASAADNFSDQREEIDRIVWVGDEQPAPDAGGASLKFKGRRPEVDEPISASVVHAAASRRARGV